MGEALPISPPGHSRCERQGAQSARRSPRETARREVWCLGPPCFETSLEALTHFGGRAPYHAEARALGQEGSGPGREA